MAEKKPHRCTLDLPEDLVRKAKRVCFEEGKPFQAGVREAVEAWLAQKGYPEILEKIYSGEKEAPLISDRPKSYKRKAKRFYPGEGEDHVD